MSGLPWKYKILARLAGVDTTMLANLWKWSDGKKTWVGGVVTALGTVAALVPQLSELFPNAKWLVVVGGAVQTINGLAHKAYKARYSEEHVSPK